MPQWGEVKIFAKVKKAEGGTLLSLFSELLTSAEVASGDRRKDVTRPGRKDGVQEWSGPCAYLQPLILSLGGDGKLAMLA